MISPIVMLAPGLAGVLTGVCYRSATDYVTLKLTEEWCQLNIILLNAVAIAAHKLRQELGSNSEVIVLVEVSEV